MLRNNVKPNKIALRIYEPDRQVQNNQSTGTGEYRVHLCLICILSSAICIECTILTGYNGIIRQIIYQIEMEEDKKRLAFVANPSSRKLNVIGIMLRKERVYERP